MKKYKLISLLMVGALGLAGCGDGNNSSAAGNGQNTTDQAPEEMTSITVGNIPFAETATVHIAINEGIFAEHGLDVTLTDAPGGGAGLVTALMSGDIDITYSNYPTIIQAADQGLPVTLIRENDRGRSQALYVKADGSLDNIEDLEGKSIAINGLGNIMEITTRAVLEDHGITDVEFMEIEPPQMAVNVENGNVDAAWLVEPFITSATVDGDLELLTSAFQGRTENLPVAGWVTRQDYAANNPEIIEAFASAIDEASKLAIEDQELLESTLEDYTEIPPEVIAQLNPIGFVEDSTFEGLDTLNDLMLDQGHINNPVEVEELIHDNS